MIHIVCSEEEKENKMLDLHASLTYSAGIRKEAFPFPLERKLAVEDSWLKLLCGLAEPT